jgi:hypothetical protein
MTAIGVNKFIDTVFKGCWKIQARVENDKSGNFRYSVKCVHCGEVAEFQHANLKSGSVRTCKCLKTNETSDKAKVPEMKQEVKQEVCNKLIQGLNSVDNSEDLIERAFNDIGLQKEVQELREETKNLKIESRNKGIAVREMEESIKVLGERIKDLETALQVKDSELKIKDMLEVTRKATFTQKIEEIRIKEVTLNRQMEKLGIKC